MNLIAAFLLVILTGQSTATHLQSLNCPYENRNISGNKARVWCKRDAQDKNCCTGFSFQQGVNVLDQGTVYVEDDGKSFTVSVRELSQGDGVYWCGFMTDDKIIVKLAEDYLTNAPFNSVWLIVRWILFLLLSVMTISVHVYSNKRHEDTKAT